MNKKLRLKLDILNTFDVLKEIGINEPLIKPKNINFDRSFIKSSSSSSIPEFGRKSFTPKYRKPVYKIEKPVQINTTQIDKINPIPIKRLSNLKKLLIGGLGAGVLGSGIYAYLDDKKASAAKKDKEDNENVVIDDNENTISDYKNSILKQYIDEHE